MKSFYISFLPLLAFIGPWELQAQNAVNPIVPETKALAIQKPYYPQQERVPGGGILTFEEEVHDFGEMAQGGDASWVFKFTNTGTEIIVLEQVKPGGGSVVAKWPREPIGIGQSGEIRVMYDSNHVGGFDKSVAIISNASEPYKRLYIKGTIVPKPAGPTFLAPIEAAPAQH